MKLLTSSSTRMHALTPVLSRQSSAARCYGPFSEMWPPHHRVSLDWTTEELGGEERRGRGMIFMSEVVLGLCMYNTSSSSPSCFCLLSPFFLHSFSFPLFLLHSFSFPLFLLFSFFLPPLSLSPPSLPLSSLPYRTTLMCVSSEQSHVPTRDVRQCYHTTNWSHMNKTAPSGEWRVNTVTQRLPLANWRWEDKSSYQVWVRMGKQWLDWSLGRLVLVRENWSSYLEASAYCSLDVLVVQLYLITSFSLWFWNLIKLRRDC